MNRRLTHLSIVGLSVLGLSLLCSTAAAQPGSAVQLPTYSFFSTGTTVSVPDRGSVYLGGIKRAESGRSEFGLPFRPFGNRSIGMTRSAASNRVSVSIHDFDAMDEYLLSQPTKFASQRSSRQDRGIAWQPPSIPKPVLQTAVEPSEPSGPAAMSVAELQARHRIEQATREDEAVRLFHQGERAETEGKQNVARIYYQMAARRASEQFKPQVLARLEMVTETKLAIGH